MQRQVPGHVAGAIISQQTGMDTHTMCGCGTTLTGTENVNELSSETPE